MKISVVVIQTPNSDRHIPLTNLLVHDSRFYLIPLKATMLNSIDQLQFDSIPYNQAYFQFYENRKMSFREIGCAKSHNDARILISKIYQGGVILEDDARIVNMDDFYNQSRQFLDSHKNSLAVLSLTGFRGLSKKLVKSQKSHTLPLRGQPDLAVGYALTSLAASNLVEANSPITSVSDWPTSSCEFHTTLEPPILHGDASTISVIDMNGNLRNGPSTLFKIKSLLFISYLKKAHLDINFKDYYERVFLRRLYWSIDLWRLKIKLIRCK